MSESHELEPKLETRTIVERVYLHARPVRGDASPEFLRNRRHLVKQLDLGCWICNSRDHREVHHIHEHAQWGDLDPDKVLDNLHVFDPYGFTRHAGETPITSPDDVRNLLVLCGHCTIEGVEVPGGHHRGVDAGIHEVTFPTLLALRAAREGVVITQAVARAVKAHRAESEASA